MLAALRLWQSTPSLANNPMFEGYFSECARLSSEEIDKLCETLNVEVGPTNEQRTEWAQTALEAFTAAVGEDVVDADSARDLIADLLHWLVLKADIPTARRMLRRAILDFTHESDLQESFPVIFSGSAALWED